MSIHGRLKPRPSPNPNAKDDPVAYYGPAFAAAAGHGMGAHGDEGGPLLSPRILRVVPSQLMSLLAALSYGSASLAMVFINKGLLMRYRYSMTLLTLQMAASAIFVTAGGRLRLISLRPFELRTARALLPVAFFYNANVAFALASLEGVNIPMYIALKRLTPMAVLVAGACIGKSRPPLQVTLSVVLTVIGCIIAALGDFSFDLYGYGMALTSVLFQTGYLLMVEKSGLEDGLSSSELLLYNAALSLPMLLLLVLGTGEAFKSVPQLITMCSGSMGFTAVIVVSLVMGIVLNFTMFWCTIANSALTTTIVGVLKGVFTTALGFFVLGGVEVHALNVTGLVINSLGGVWYSYAKYQQKHSKGGRHKDMEKEPLLPMSTAPQPQK